ncbi:Gfo/Idh/MocA family oxidoreductase [Deinococcus deserti]|uniref:Putative NADH-dependent dehydrogenase n=1 Tax=Deinococcus deserti (strain DSM 17065 / CIP 109153 / LMG 22923 / VCD115) TaxID=546414 RepID=C1D3R3_DEIDV|nr:Gfo/Idh/MocA family oxidoreductase [Deinococcus deserti]ACO48142.1 putative NADH-dependent dehydrogenase [Deinococcus deserti VCD115]
MPTRIALLGAAHVHADAYAAWLTGCKHVELLGFSEDSPHLAAEFAARTGLRHLPLAQLLESGPDGVIVCSETARHRFLVEAAAQAGAHVLCEKPIALTLDDARAMNQACLQAGVEFRTAFPVRFSPEVQNLRHMVLTGGLGQILAYGGVNHSVCPDRERQWFSDPLMAGGGAGMDHIVHLADLFHLFGEQVETVYARLVPVPEWVLPEHARVDAAALVTLRFASGASATIDSSWSRPRTYPRWGHLKLDVTGTQGLQTLDVFAESLAITNSEGRHWAGYGTDLNALMLRDFLNVCTLREHSSGADWHAGYQALRVVLAAYQAEAGAQAVHL